MEDVMRIALLAVGFFAGLWLHEAGLRSVKDPSAVQNFELANIRHTLETNFCDRVRVDVRVVDRGGVKAGVLEPVLVCDCRATSGLETLGAVRPERTVITNDVCRIASPEIRRFEGL
jgi:hypothetical protein